MKTALHYIAFILIGLTIGSCQKDLPNQAKGNLPPTTRLWISSQTDLYETLSRQHVHFYGEDPDGYVTGFLIATEAFGTTLSQIPNPDTLTYAWTTKNDTLIALPLYAKRDSFTIIVRAADNNFSSTELPLGALVKGFPEPYWDRDSNGTYSTGDVLLPTMMKAIDPTGAIQLFPIVNTPPQVQFAVISADIPFTIEQAETTFTAAAFSWVGSDDDGHQTLKSYYLALNDTSDYSNWFELPSSAVTKSKGEADTVRVMLYVKRQESDNASGTVSAEVFTGNFGNLQLRGTLPNLKLNAENVLYLKAKDVADDSSATIRMPSTSSRKWYVKKPKSRMLVVADFGSISSKNYIVNFYRDILTQNSPRNPNAVSVLNDQLKDFDVLDRSHFPHANFYNPTFIKTLQLYDIVLWFTDIAPNISAAQIGLFYYVNTLNTERNTYGRVIFTTQYQNNPTYAELRAYNDFAPLDSTTTEVQYGYNRLHVKSLITLLDTVKVAASGGGMRDSLIYKKDSITAVNVRLLPQSSGFPVLFTDSITTGGFPLQPSGAHTAFFKKLYKRTDAQYIYKLEETRTFQRTGQGVLIVDADYQPVPEYRGELEMGIIDNQKRFVMFGLPLHLLNGWEHNLPLFFKKVIEEEFGLQ